MKRVAIDGVDPAAFGDDADRRSLSAALDASDVALNHYRIAPGEGFPGGLHGHADQEEIFVVLSGEATFEWLGSERTAAREVAVSESEAIRFAPGEYQSGRNENESDLVALALGAPRESEDVRVPLDCPECGHGDLRPEWRGAEDETGNEDKNGNKGENASEGGAVLVCPDCGAANVPDGCPDCGAEMRVALGEDAATVVVCPDCGADAPTPFGT